jgi:hypothetical protein
LETIPYLFSNSLDPFNYASGGARVDGEPESQFDRGQSDRHITELRVSVVHVEATRNDAGSIGLGLEERDGIPTLYVVDPAKVGQTGYAASDAAVDGSLKPSKKKYMYLGQVPEGAALLRVNGLDVTRETLENVVHMIKGSRGFLCPLCCAHFPF